MVVRNLRAVFCAELFSLRWQVLAPMECDTRHWSEDVPILFVEGVPGLFIFPIAALNIIVVPERVDSAT